MLCDDGSVSVFTKCPRCNGDGFFTYRYGHDQFGLSPCQMCHGGGRVASRDALAAELTEREAMLSAMEAV